MRVGADAISVLTGVRTVDTDNDGSVDGAESLSRCDRTDPSRSVVTYSPFTELAIRAGRLPVPFTSQAQASDTALLFSERAGPGRLFQAADDLGALLAVNLDERVSTSLGVFNGDGMGVDASSVRGAMYMGRLDLHPLGSMDFDESRPQDQAFRFGLGGGVIGMPTPCLIRLVTTTSLWVISALRVHCAWLGRIEYVDRSAVPLAAG